MIGVSARKELGCDEETDTGCGSSGLALPGVQARNAAEAAGRRPWPVRPLVPDANPAAARLAIAAEVYHDSDDHLTAARIPPSRITPSRITPSRIPPPGSRRPGPCRDDTITATSRSLTFWPAPAAYRSPPSPTGLKPPGCRRETL